MIPRAFFCTVLAGSLAAAPAHARARAPVAGPREGPEPAPRGLLAFGRAVPLAPALALTRDPDGPAPPSPELLEWTEKRDKLKLQTQISGGLSGGFLALGLLLMFIPSPCSGTCDDPSDGWVIRMIIGTAMLPAAGAALISTIVHGVRLKRHKSLRPVARLGVAPGGLMLRF